MYPKNSKFGNIKVEVDGIKFDSGKEAGFYQNLKLLEKAGNIKDLELQPTYTLLEGFKYKGETIRKIKYIADFSYYDINEKLQVIVDVKGFKTKDYMLKKKMFLKIIKDHNDTIFKEI